MIEPETERERRFGFKDKVWLMVASRRLRAVVVDVDIRRGESLPWYRVMITSRGPHQHDRYEVSEYALTERLDD